MLLFCLFCIYAGLLIWCQLTMWAEHRRAFAPAGAEQLKAGTWWLLLGVPIAASVPLLIVIVAR